MAINPNPPPSRTQALAARIDDRMNRLDASSHEAYHDGKDVFSASARAVFHTANLVRRGVNSTADVFRPRNKTPLSPTAQAVADAGYRATRPGMRMPEALKDPRSDVELNQQQFLTKQNIEPRDTSILRRAEKRLYDANSAARIEHMDRLTEGRQVVGTRTKKVASQGALVFMNAWTLGRTELPMDREDYEHALAREGPLRTHKPPTQNLPPPAATLPAVHAPDPFARNEALQQQAVFGADPRTKLAPDLRSYVPKGTRANPTKPAQMRLAAEALAVDAHAARITGGELLQAARLIGDHDLYAFIDGRDVRRAFGKLKAKADQESATGGAPANARPMDPRLFGNPNELVAMAHRHDESHLSLLKRAIHAGDAQSVQALLSPQVRDAFATTSPPAMNPVTGRAQGPEPLRQVPHPAAYRGLRDAPERYAADARKAGFVHSQLLAEATRSGDLGAQQFLSHPATRQAFRRYPEGLVPIASNFLPRAGASRADIQAAADAFARDAVDAGSNRAELFALGKLRGDAQGLRFLRSSEVRSAFDKLSPPGTRPIELKDRSGAPFVPDFTRQPHELAAQAHAAGVTPFELFEAARVNGNPAAARLVASREFSRAAKALQDRVPPRPPAAPRFAAEMRPAQRPDTRGLPTPPDTPPQLPPRVASDRTGTSRHQADDKIEAWAQTQLDKGRTLPQLREAAIRRDDPTTLAKLDGSRVRAAFARLAAKNAPDVDRFRPEQGSAYPIGAAAYTLARAARAANTNIRQLYETERRKGNTEGMRYLTHPEVVQAFRNVGLHHGDIVLKDRHGNDFRADFNLPAAQFAREAQRVGITPIELYEAARRNGNTRQANFILDRDVMRAFKDLRHPARPTA